MNQDFLRIIDSISRERNLDKEVLFIDVEQAMVSAARKHFNAEDPSEFTCEVDRITGEIRLYRHGEQIPLESLGRIPAQTAKQVMIQRFREDERDSIFEEFANRVGEIVTGTVQRYEGSSLIISLGRAEGIMPRSEQIPGEMHTPGERLRCLVHDVRDTGSQVKIILTRANPEFIERLFEVEVPEVQERVIEIRALSREPGHRSKVAVSSIDSKVDAVGACVGVRGSRIKNIVDELGGEKIDVVRWNDSSQVLIANALRPAEISEISLCFELGRATVVVNDDQLSLAIGKRGQNVRLAARLTNWDIDILTPIEYDRGLQILQESMETVEGMEQDMIDRLMALGFISVVDIEDVGEEVLVEQLGEFGMTMEIAIKCVDVAALRAKEYAEEMERAREEAELNNSGPLPFGGSGGASGDGQTKVITNTGWGAGEDDSDAAPAPAGSSGGGDILSDLVAARSQEQSSDDADTDSDAETPAEPEAAQDTEDSADETTDESSDEQPAAETTDDTPDVETQSAEETEENKTEA